MHTPIDGKSKLMYVIYGDKLAWMAGALEYMSPTALTHLIHKDSLQNNLLVEIVKNMGIQQKHKNQGKRYSSFSNFIEGKLLHLTRHAFVMNSTVQYVTGREIHQKWLWK